MFDIGILLKRFGKVAAENSPAILTAVGATGVLTTAYFTGRAAYKSVDVLKEAEEAKEEEFQGQRAAEELEGDIQEETPETQMHAEPLTFQEKAGAVWKLYVPAAASATLTITAIICAARINDRRTAAIASAYSALEKGYSEYRAKNIEKLGKKKEQELRDEIAQDRVNANPPTKVQVQLVGEGNVLCFDEHTGRYFSSDMQSLRRAENDLNFRIRNEDAASLSDYFDALGIKHTTGSDNLGWRDKVEFRITTTVSDTAYGERPCFSIEFSRLPVPLFAY